MCRSRPEAKCWRFGRFGLWQIHHPRLVAGLERVDGGKSAWARVVSAPGALCPPKRRVGMVFQDYALFPHLSAAANVAFGIEHLPRPEREALALSWLDRVGLKARAGAFAHELSGGEQRRVALARALAPKPRAVLLDEPSPGSIRCCARSCAR